MFTKERRLQDSCWKHWTHRKKAEDECSVKTDWGVWKPLTLFHIWFCCKHNLFQNYMEIKLQVFLGQVFPPASHNQSSLQSTFVKLKPSMFFFQLHNPASLCVGLSQKTSPKYFKLCRWKIKKKFTVYEWCFKAQWKPLLSQWTSHLSGFCLVSKTHSPQQHRWSTWGEMWREIFLKNCILYIFSWK